MSQRPPIPPRQTSPGTRNLTNPPLNHRLLHKPQLPVQRLPRRRRVQLHRLHHPVQIRQRLPQQSRSQPPPPIRRIRQHHPHPAHAPMRHRRCRRHHPSLFLHPKTTRRRSSKQCHPIRRRLVPSRRPLQLHTIIQVPLAQQSNLRHRASILAILRGDNPPDESSSMVTPRRRRRHRRW